MILTAFLNKAVNFPSFGLLSLCCFARLFILWRISWLSFSCYSSGIFSGCSYSLTLFEVPFTSNPSCCALRASLSLLIYSSNSPSAESTSSLTCKSKYNRNPVNNANAISLSNRSLSNVAIFGKILSKNPSFSTSNLLFLVTLFWGSPFLSNSAP